MLRFHIVEIKRNERAFFILSYANTRNPWNFGTVFTDFIYDRMIN